MPSLKGRLRKLGLYFAYKALSQTLRIIAHFMSLLFSPKRSQIPPIDDHNIITPAIKLSQQIRDGHVTSEEVVESFISRIKRVNPIINAVVEKRFEDALKEAQEIDRKLQAARNNEGDRSILSMPLVGVPVSVKESIGVDGYSNTGGLLSRRFVKAPKHADAVKLLMSNGMIPIALTNIPELGMWWDASNPVYGCTNNPYDLGRIPGGSSGGEGALLAAAGSVIGIGSDIAGSIRMPANFCGVFGHKPTPFVVSNVGTYPTIKGEREKLFGIGPMTRYACDMAPMLKVLAGTKVSKLRLDEPVDMKKLKVFYVEELGDPLAASCNADMLERLREAVKHLANTYKIPSHCVRFDEFQHGFLLWSAEAHTDPDTPALSKLFNDGLPGELNPVVEIAKKALQTSPHNMNSIVATTLDKFSPGHGTRESKILTARAASLRRGFEELVGDDGVLLVPTHPEPAPKHHTTFLKVFNVSYTSVTSVLQAPITQCPLGLSDEGLPFGVQIIAKPYNDRLTLAVAQELEKAFGGWIPPCRIDT